LLIATLNSCINGYDGSLMGAINSYPQYRSYFGFSLTEGTPSTGIVYAIYTIGNLVGSFAAGPATDFRGEFPYSRKPGNLQLLTALRA
jgi:MFS family permease